MKILEMNDKKMGRLKVFINFENFIYLHKTSLLLINGVRFIPSLLDFLNSILQLNLDFQNCVGW